MSIVSMADEDRAERAARAAAAKKKQARRKKRRARLGVLGIVFAMGGFFVLPSIIVFLAGMIPTIVAYMTDRDEQKYAALTVGPTNIAGVVPMIIELWLSYNHSVSGAIALLLSPISWLVMLAPSVLGWVCYNTVPKAVSQYLTKRAREEITQIRRRQSRMVQEWGEEVRHLDKETAPKAGQEDKFNGEDWVPLDQKHAAPGQIAP
jgi:hypothetical protein